MVALALAILLALVKEAPYVLCWEKPVAQWISCVTVNWLTGVPGYVEVEKETGWSGPLVLYQEGQGPHPADYIYNGEVPNLKDYGQFTTIICGLSGPPLTPVCH